MFAVPDFRVCFDPSSGLSHQPLWGFGLLPLTVCVDCSTQHTVADLLSAQILLFFLQACTKDFHNFPPEAEAFTT